MIASKLKSGVVHGHMKGRNAISNLKVIYNVVVLRVMVTYLLFLATNTKPLWITNPIEIKLAI
jgi:hypothetical protein